MNFEVSSAIANSLPVGRFVRISAARRKEGVHFRTARGATGVNAPDDASPQIFSQEGQTIRRASKDFLGFPLCANVRETPEVCVITEQGEKVFDEC
jgi:hypothetical protein